MRDLITALQFLTRLPLPAVQPRGEPGLGTSWYPVAGLLIGLLLALAGWIGASVSPIFAALLITIAWVAITGALHLDGVADLADARGAAHRDRDRFLAVLKSPQVGSFGVVALLLIVLSKLVTLNDLVACHDWMVLVLIPAWGRWGVLYWGVTLKPFSRDGWGARLAGDVDELAMIAWGVALFVVTTLAHSLLFALASLTVILLWRRYLQQEIGGMNGDCLGAGIEISECAMLLLALLIH